MVIGSLHSKNSQSMSGLISVRLASNVATTIILTPSCSTTWRLSLRTLHKLYWSETIQLGPIAFVLRGLHMNFLHNGVTAPEMC